MGQFDLNLSTRPFKPYRAANLGLLALLLALIAITIAQAYSYRQYSSLAAGIRANERKATAEADQLRTELLKLNSEMYSNSASSKFTEIDFLNQLLLKKGFSWTRVFANLEQVLPENVHLISLVPFVDEKGKLGLNMEIRGRSLSDATEFIRVLETSQVFADVAVASEKKKDVLPTGEVEVSLSTYYYPERAGE